ncbi:MAG: acyl carrier protein [Thermoanaerobaculia bacterium]
MNPAIADDVLPRLLDLIARVCRKDATPESRFIEDLSMDSIDLVSLVSEMEEEFGVIVGEEQLRTFHTVGDAAACLRTLRNGGEGAA